MGSRETGPSEGLDKMTWWGFPGGASGKEPTCQCRGHKRRVQSLGEDPLEEGIPLQDSYLENPLDRGAC